MVMRNHISIALLAFGWAFQAGAVAQEKKPDAKPAEAQAKAPEQAKPDAKPADSKVTRDYDVVYTKAGDVELKLDIVRPAGEGEPLATVIVIHGGGWRGGNKESNRRVLDLFAEKGFVAVSPQYRLVPKAIFPAQVHDLKAAVRWLKTNAGKYRIDPERIGAMGFSAGGHLAMMLGTTDNHDGLEGNLPPAGPNTKIRAVVNYFGPTDLDAADIPDVSKPLVDAFLGGPVATKQKEVAQSSPLDLIGPEDAPILTFQGTKDPLVPHSQAIKLAEAMTEKGVRGRVTLFVGDGHGWEGIESTFDEAAEFFEKNLQKNDSENMGRRRRR